MKTIRLLGAALACSCLISTQANAYSIGALEYEGGIFDLTASTVDAANHIYDITYTADFSGFTNTEQIYFRALDWKWQGEKIVSASLTSAPSGIGNWSVDTFEKVAASADGCTVGGGDAALCSEWTASNLGVDTQSGDIYNWVFNVKFDSEIDVNALLGNTLRGLYVDANGSKIGAIMSCTTGTQEVCTPRTVAEPSALALLGLGLLGLGFARRKMRN